MAKAKIKRIEMDKVGRAKQIKSIETELKKTNPGFSLPDTRVSR